MECQEARPVLIDLLYGEEAGSLPPGFREHFSRCPQCAAEYLDLRETRHTFSLWKDEEPPERLVFLKPQARKSPWLSLSLPPWFRPSMAYAAALLLLALGVVLGRVQLAWGEGTVALQSAWLTPAAAEPVRNPLPSPTLGPEVLVSLEKILSQQEARQNQQTLSLLQKTMDALEYQRQADLTRLREELGSLQQTYYQTIERNSLLLEQNARFMRQSKY